MSGSTWRPIWFSALVSLAVVVAGVAAVGAVTRGFSALTAEDARRLDVAVRPVTLAPVRIQDHTGASWLVGPPAGAKEVDSGTVTIVTFMYSRCRTLCASISAQMRQMQHEIQSRGMAGRIRLLSVSFDPGQDTPTRLHEYASRLGAAPEVWRLARPVDADQLPHLLDAFGVQVVPTPDGEFEHNAAFHLVDGRGRLVEVVDVASADQALASAWRRSEASDLSTRAQAMAKAGGV